jgi:hypothetical protein
VSIILTPWPYSFIRHKIGLIFVDTEDPKGGLYPHEYRYRGKSITISEYG